MSPADIRAVENPISAIFELAEDVNKEAPRLRKLVRYASIFVGFWLVLDFILILQNIPYSLFLEIILILLFAIGIWTLLMLRNLNDFLNYYTRRHAVILSVRDDDPVVFAPQGDTSVERLKLFLGGRNPALGSAIVLASKAPTVLKGRSGLFYGFDAYVRSRPGPLWRALGFGYPGYQLFVKHFDRPPKMDDIFSLKKAVEDVSAANKMPASRVIALWDRREDQEISEDVYNFVTTITLDMKHRYRHFTSSMELIIENEDGSYEFIPFVNDNYFPTSRAQ